MKTLFKFCLIISIISITSCTDEQVLQSDPINGAWLLISYEDHQTGATIQQTSTNSNGEDVTIHFSEVDDINYVTAYDGFNTLNGKYSTFDENNISFTETSTTLVGGAPFWSEHFSTFFFTELDYYEVDDSQQRIYYEQESKSVVFDFIE